jgi:hypothetical protein
VKKSFETHKNQTDASFLTFPCVPLRNGGRCNSVVLDSIAECSAKGGMTLTQARIALRIHGNKVFGQNYVMSSNSLPNKIEKWNLIPSRPTSERRKHRLAIKQEKNCALAMLEKSDSQKCILSYDTTTRQKFKGEMTSLIVKVAGKEFRARSLTLGHEDGENIVRYFLEQLERFAIAAKSTPKEIWEKTDGLMTDSASKNLGIAHRIAVALNSEHIPNHFLCNSHFCDCLDRGNLLKREKGKKGKSQLSGQYNT